MRGFDNAVQCSHSQLAAMLLLSDRHDANVIVF